MPEFEEPKAESSSKENYTPSIDASDKPRSRRRSGGFKTTPATTSIGIGEIDPAEALKTEKLSGGSKSEPKPKKEKSAPKAEKPVAKREKPRSSTSKAQPSPETLAAIQNVEARLAERKKKRDARHAEREKTRPAKGGRESTGRHKGSSSKAQSKGLFASILSFFGLGPKPPAKKQGGNGKPSGPRRQGDRPRGKGGNRGQSQNRRGSGKGRRSGGKGPRRDDRRSQSKNA